MSLSKRTLAAYSFPASPIAARLVVYLPFRYPLDENVQRRLQARLAAERA